MIFRFKTSAIELDSTQIEKGNYGSNLSGYMSDKDWFSLFWSRQRQNLNISHFKFKTSE